MSVAKIAADRVGRWVAQSSHHQLQTTHYINRFACDEQTENIPTWYALCGKEIRSIRTTFGMVQECKKCREAFNEKSEVAPVPRSADKVARIKEGLWFLKPTKVETPQRTRKIVSPADVSGSWYLDLGMLCGEGPVIPLNSSQLKALQAALVSLASADD